MGICRGGRRNSVHCSSHYAYGLLRGHPHPPHSPGTGLFLGRAWVQGAAAGKSRRVAAIPCPPFTLLLIRSSLLLAIRIWSA